MPVLHDGVNLQGVDILLVEDDASARAATQRLLEMYGAAVRASNSAAQAQEAFRSRRPDVILADIGMPDTDGYTLLSDLRRLEREEKTQRVPAVAVTAFARDEDRARALSAGFDEHLSKPVDPETLVSVVADLLSDS